MTAKEYLSQLKLLDLKINQKIEESSALRELVKGRGMAYDGDRVQTSPRNAQEDLIIRYTDLEQDIDGMIDQYLYLKDRIINEIHQLSDSRFVRILHDHYVPDQSNRVKSLEQIAVELDYTYKYVCELHGYALQEFSRKITGQNRTNSD